MPLTLDEQFDLTNYRVMNGGQPSVSKGTLSEVYNSLGSRGVVAGASLPHHNDTYMSWVPVLVSVDNLHSIRPLARKLSKQHALAYGRYDSGHAILIFPIDRNVKVICSPDDSYKTIWQSLLCYFQAITKKAAKELSFTGKVSRMPYLRSGATLVKRAHSQDGLGVVKNAKFKNSELAKDSHQLAVQIWGNGDEHQASRVLAAVQRWYFAKLREENKDKTNDEDFAAKQLFDLFEEVDKKQGEHQGRPSFEDLKHKAQSIQSIEGAEQTLSREKLTDLVVSPYNLYGLKASYSLNFTDGRRWTIPTTTLMKMAHDDSSDSSAVHLKMVRRKRGKSAGEPVPGVVTNYVIEIMRQDVCGTVLTFNKLTKRPQLSHALNNEYIHTDADADFSQPVDLKDGLTTQIEMALEMLECQATTHKKVVQAIGQAARRRSYDPVRDYLRALPKWDGKDRLSTLFIRYLGTPDSKIIRRVSLLFGVGAVHLALHPGSKFDLAFDLVGDQGVGKTTLLQKYFNSYSTSKTDPTWNRGNFNWYIQDLHSFTDKDSILSMIGHLIVNDDEMTMSNRERVDTLKAAATMQQTSVRVPYAETPETYGRSWMIARTTNKTHNLYYSSNGLRKFVPIRVIAANHTEDCAGPDSTMTPWVVDQLWAQAYAFYEKLRADQKLVDFLSLSKKEEEQLQEMRVSLQYLDDKKVALFGAIKDQWAASNYKWGQVRFTTSSLVSDVSDALGSHVSPKDIRPVMVEDFGFKSTTMRYEGRHVAGYVSTSETPTKFEAVKAEIEGVQTKNKKNTNRKDD